MTVLADRQCEACRADSPRVTGKQLADLRAELPEWRIDSVAGIDRLVRRYPFSDFASALSFTNRIGALAEAEDHHPDLLTRWGSVEVTWWTHAIDGLHANDFIMAARCDREFLRG